MGPEAEEGRRRVGGREGWGAGRRAGEKKAKEEGERGSKGEGRGQDEERERREKVRGRQRRGGEGPLGVPSPSRHLHFRGEEGKGSRPSTP